MQESDPIMLAVNHSPIQIPSRRFSLRSDRERNATEYARALSSDVTPYAASIISSSDSNSYYRSSRGSRSSIASSLLCPLLDFHDSSRRQSDAGVIMPMRPLPVIHPSTDPLPSSNYFSNSWIPDSSSILNQTNHSLSSSVMSNSSTTTSGSNLFIPLRRRFLPNIDRTSSATKPRVETQLFGELLLALEEYVAAFGRKVKVSAPHQFNIGDTAAAVVVSAATGSTNEDNLADPTPSDSFTASHNLFSVLEDQDMQPTHSRRDPSLKLSSSQPDPWRKSKSNFDQMNDKLDYASHPSQVNFQSQPKVDRSLLSELCEELEYVTSEVIDVVPAFGEKLMQGHYGPLAVRGRGVVKNKPVCVSDPTDIPNEARTSINKSRPSTALERFVDYEPGGSQDTSDGGPGWWAERLLRDLLEGILAESVVKCGSTNVLLSTHSNLNSSQCDNTTHLSSYNSNGEQSSNHEKTGPSTRKTNSISLRGRSKSWLRIPQSTNLVRSSSFTNAKSLYNQNVGFLLIDEDEETSASETKPKNYHPPKNPFNTRSQADPLMMDVIDQSNSTRKLLAEASEDSIFEYRALPSVLKDHDHQIDQFNPNDVILGYTKDSFSVAGQGVKTEESSSSGALERPEMKDEHRQKLLDEGQKRWLAFKAKQLQTNGNYSHLSSYSDHRHTINNPLNFTDTNLSDRDGFGSKFRDLHLAHSSLDSNGPIRNQSNHRYLYNYLALHRS